MLINYNAVFRQKYSIYSSKPT